MSTYLELTNKLLRRLGETELTESDFLSARSVQATAKDCIKASVDEIYTRQPFWPFMYQTGTQVLTIGQEEYSLLSIDVNSVDWKSFRIQENGTLNIKTTPLELISHDEWKMHLRGADEDAESDGIGVPQYVFRSSGPSLGDYNGGFGVSPSPNAAYTIVFDCFINENNINLQDDVVSIPSRYDFVIINGALKHFNMFKDNIEQGGFWTSEFEKSLKLMTRSQITKKDDMKDTRVNFGGSP